jgi:type IX secretion system PorP/SprF family membrane protein
MLITLAAALQGTAAFAQDPGFSQFFASPLTLNPALTGKFNGALRVAGNYRNQWPAVNNAFITSTISVDGNIFKDKLPENDAWGIGLMAMTDRTADGILTSNYLSLSTAYHKALDEDGTQQIGVGFQGTYTTKFLDGKRLNFQDGLQVDGTWLPSPTEPINQEEVTVHHFDMNAGILYNGSISGNDNIYAGASIYHINRPKESFLGDENIVLPTRVTVHAGCYFPSGQAGNTFYASGLFSSQATAKEFVLGGAYEINVNSDDKSPTNLYLGSWLRFSNVTDAVIPYIGLDFGSFNLGMTYDVNISAFKTASQGRGGIEISLIYILKKSDGSSNWSIPCPRF